MELSGLAIPMLVAVSFALSVIGLFIFILALSHNLLWGPDEGASVILPPGEENAPEEPAATVHEAAGLRAATKGREVREDELAERVVADRSSALAAFTF